MKAEMDSQVTAISVKEKVFQGNPSRVVLHIGMSKSGSSAIQQALVDNEAMLREAGILYPLAGRRWIAHYKIHEDIRHRRSTDRLKKALTEAEPFDTAVLSCEGFWLFDESEVDLLREALAPFEVQVILYLRRPSSYLPSSYRQGIKQRGRTQAVGAYLAGVRKEDRMNYPRLLERWGRHFPLRVRAYEAVREAIEADFMRTIGGPLERLDVRRRVVNVTPSDGAHQVMLWTNRLLPEAPARQVREAVRRSGWRFDFLPPINDEPLHRYGREVVQTWDLDVMRRYVPEEDLKLLLATGEA